MKIRSVCVIGGAGFLGSHVVRQLAARGIAVRVPTRRRERAKSLIVLPTVDVVNTDVHDSATLERLFAGTDAVISLAGILNEGRKGEFAQVHTELPRKIVDACRERGVRRLLHVSALKAAHDAPSEYLRSKADGEQQVRVAQASDIHTTIFRPSVIFGREDRFLNLFAQLAHALPVIALASPKARFQPIHVEDVARAMVESLELAHTYNKSFDLCGPAAYTLQALVEYVCKLLRLQRPILPLNDDMSQLLAWMMEWLPVKLMSRDNYLSMKLDNVCDCPFPELFGFQPAALEAVVPLYLLDETPRARYRWFRFRARH
ncbi:MAG TPA: complex I NDUFA9 subunit family protein [Burkholderiales bacterium]|nr:complex I NDUFA9 subunit family protein [Burkholderiales bacterium]